MPIEMPHGQVTVRFAEDASGEIVCIGDGRAPFTCVACRAPIVVKRASHRSRTHFSHVGDGCERWEHAAAKRLIHDHWRSVEFLRPCARCTRGRRIEPPAEAVEARMERGVACEIGRAIADVLLVDDSGAPRFAIEVVETHQVSERAAGVYAVTGVPWIEVWARDVLEAFEARARQCRQVDARRLEPLPPNECDACILARERAAEQAKAALPAAAAQPTAAQATWALQIQEAPRRASPPAPPPKPVAPAPRPRRRERPAIELPYGKRERERIEPFRLYGASCARCGKPRSGRDPHGCRCPRV